MVAPPPALWRQQFEVEVYERKGVKQARHRRRPREVEAGEHGQHLDEVLFHTRHRAITTTNIGRDGR